MLYRDGKQYKLTKQNVDDFLEATGLSWPITIKYTKDRVKYDPVNELEIYPAGIHIRPVANEITDTGLVEWRFSERVQRNRKGQDVHYPILITLNKTRTFTQKDVEFVYWMYRACPLLKGGMNEGRNPAFEFENLEKENFVKVEFNKLRAQVENVVYNELDLEELRVIAQSYFLPVASTAGENTLRVALMNHLSARSKPDDMKRFLEELESNSMDTENRSLFVLAEEQGLIKYFNQTHSWHWMNDGERGQQLAKMRSSKTGVSALYSQLRNDRSRFQEFISVVKKELKGK